MKVNGATQILSPVPNFPLVTSENKEFAAIIAKVCKITLVHTIELNGNLELSCQLYNLRVIGHMACDRRTEQFHWLPPRFNESLEYPDITVTGRNSKSTQFHRSFQ